MVRILSGMAMPTKATTGTQSEIEDRDHDADRFRASQLSQPKPNSRFCSRVRPLRARQQERASASCRICKPP